MSQIMQTNFVHIYYLLIARIKFYLLRIQYLVSCKTELHGKLSLPIASVIFKKKDMVKANL